MYIETLGSKTATQQKHVDRGREQPAPPARTVALPLAGVALLLSMSVAASTVRTR